MAYRSIARRRLRKPSTAFKTPPVAQRSHCSFWFCRYAGGADAAALSELRDACAGALRYAQEHNAYADEAEGQAALVIAWQCTVEVTFSRRCVPDAPAQLPSWLTHIASRVPCTFPTTYKHCCPWVWEILTCS